MSRDYESEVKSLGKFEGEERYVPYFWDYVLEGASGIIDFPNDQRVDYVIITTDDVLIFPELKEHVGEYVIMEESDQGFVSGRIVSQRFIEKLEAEAEEEYSNDSE